MEMHAPQLYRPVCFLQGQICQGAQPGARFPPAWTGQMFTDSLRKLPTRFGREGARRLGAHRVRGGAARSILETGGTFAQILIAGQWHSSAYRLYLHLGAEGAADMSRLLIESPDDEGDDG